ncbi:linear amide C-N hydrolase [Halodesulfovibrio aestuarii]|uniref:Linear amide C-N hydrolase n=1 Tax=Halodesulfovibrio aestuarii TaxID=126333 RepID=A0ABV4JNC5_9BACT
MQKITHFFIVTCCAICLLNTAIAQACTGVRVQSTDGAVTFARTLEFTTSLKSNLLFTPRRQQWTSPTPDGKKGMTWENQYAFLGPNGLNEPLLLGGINEKGLYIGAFWFPKLAKYQEATKDEITKVVAPSIFTALLLGTCATLDDVRNKIAQIKLVGVINTKLGMVPPLHWYAMDKSGKALVIEPISGEIVITENPVGVFTNAPQFSWHLQNLSNYMNLTSNSCKPKKIHSYTATSIGQGSGMLGLPGDFTPPSRFVRAALLSNATDPVSTADEAINQSFMLISNISIAKGLVKTIQHDKKPSIDYTQWTAVYDLTRRRCYFKTYDNQDVRVVHLDKLPHDGKQILTIPMWNSKPEYKDVTGQAK